MSIIFLASGKWQNDNKGVGENSRGDLYPQPFLLSQSVNRLINIGILSDPNTQQKTNITHKLIDSNDGYQIKHHNTKCHNVISFYIVFRNSNKQLKIIGNHIVFVLFDDNANLGQNFLLYIHGNPHFYF